jgi:hypothetical protein
MVSSFLSNLLDYFVNIFSRRFRLLNILTIVLLGGTLFDNTIYAAANVIRQEIKDPNEDMELLTNSKECQELQNRTNFPEIVALSYSSNGTTLNATGWLSSYLRNFSSVMSLTFVLSIKIPSIYNNKPIDYQLSMLWDNSTGDNPDGKWIRFLDELSSTNTSRILEEDYDYSYKLAKDVIDFSLDMGRLTYPDQYSLFLSEFVEIKTGRHSCFLADASNRVIIPNPTLSLLVSPNPVNLRPGEHKILEIQVQSAHPMGFNPLVQLSANNQSDTELRFESNNITLHADNQPGTVFSPLEIKLKDNATPRQFSVPLSAYLNNPPTSSPTEVPDIQNATTVLYPPFARLSQNQSLSVIVLEPLTLEEKWTNFWNAYGGLISFVGAGFAAGFASLVFDKLRKSKRNKKQKSEDSPSD